MEEDSDTGENDKDEKLDLQEKKLKEVEKLLIEEKGRWKCKTCKKRSACRRHAQNHVSGLSFPCIHCSERFTTQVRLYSHKKDKHKDQRATRKRYVDIEDIDPNTRKILHNKKLKEVENLLIKAGDLWQCKVCDKNFKNKGNLRFHAEIHVEGLSYQCPSCPKICPNKKSRKNHMDNNHRGASKSDFQTHKNTNVDKLFNDVIYTIFDSENTKELQNINSESSEEENSDLQQQKYKDEKLDLQEQKLNEVEELMIKEKGQWKCKTCKKIFRKRSSCHRHAQNHVSGLSLPCIHCSESLPTQARLWTHKNEKHRNVIEEGKAAKNEYIYIDQKTRQKLEEVENLLIKAGDLWKCKVCDKTSKAKTVLRQHAEIHVEGLSYQCPSCPKICPNKKSLTNHKMRNHRT